MREPGWVKSVFSEDEKISQNWQKWAVAETRSSQELAELVYGPFQEEYQKRALYLLLTPDTRLAVFAWGAWKHSLPFHYLNYEVDFGKVEARLRAHAVYWLTEFIDYARHQPMDENRQAVLLSAYYKYILRLLEVVPAEDNQRELLLPYVSADKQITQAQQKVKEQEIVNNKLLEAMKRPADIPLNEKEQSET